MFLETDRAAKSPIPSAELPLKGLQHVTQPLCGYSAFRSMAVLRQMQICVDSCCRFAMLAPVVPS